MASPVKETKAQHQGLGFTEVIKRHRASLTSRNPLTGRIRCTSQLGGAGFHFGTDPFTEANEIDATWIDADPILDDPWLKKMVLADYHVYFGRGTGAFNAGQIIEYIHPASGESVTFEVQQLDWTNDIDQILAIGDPTNAGPTSIIDNTVRWDEAFGPGLRFDWYTHTTRFGKALRVEALSDIGAPSSTIIAGGNPVARLKFIFQKSAGVEIWLDGVEWNERPNNPITTAGDVEFRLASTGETLWYFNQPTVLDNSRLDPDVTLPPVIEQRIRKTGPNLFVEVRVPWSWLETAVYPVIIDPTIDEQVGAGGDDGGVWGTAGFASTNQFINVQRTGGKNYHAWFRYTGVTIDANVDASYMELWLTVEDGTATQNIYGVDEDNPAAPTNFGEFDGEPLTDASVPWDDIAVVSDFDASPSLNTIFQELTDSYTITDEAVMLQLLTDSANNNGFQTYAFDHGSNPERAGKLHVESSTGAPSPITISMGVATLASSAQGLNVIPGAKSVEMQEAALVSSPQALSVDAPPPAQTIPMTAPNLVSAPQALNVIPGAKLVQMSEATLVGAAQALSLILGSVSVPMSEATLVSAAQALTIIKGGVSPQMSAATLVSAAQALGIISGATSVEMSPATLVSAAQALNVYLAGAPQTISMGYATLVSEAQALNIYLAGSPQTIKMGYATLVASAEGLTPIGGAISIPMGAATLQGLLQSLAVVLSGAPQTISMVAATLASAAQGLNVNVGGVNISLSAISLASSLQDLFVQAGTVVLPMGAVTVQGLPQALNVESSVKISMQPMTLVGDPQSLIPIGGAVSVSLSAITLVASLQSLTVILFVPTPALLMIHNYLINILSTMDKQPTEILIEDVLVSDLADFIRSEYES